MDATVETIEKNTTQQVQIRLRVFGGKQLIDIRVFWSEDAKTWHPSKKGVALRVDKLPQLLRALSQAAQMVGQSEPSGDNNNGRGTPDAEGCSLFEMVERYERRVILDMLARTDWSQTEAAERFRIPLSTLNQKIKRLKIERPRPASVKA